MEEIFVAEILAEKFFAEFVFAILMGTNRKNNFCEIFLKWFSHKNKTYLLVIYLLYILKIPYVKE